MTFRLRHTQGFTLLEVMVALAIFSVGLLGLGGLLVVSIKTNHSAYNRTQATFLAQTMADRIRANRMGLWTNLYNGDYSSATAAAPANTCEGASGCSVEDAVKRDKAIWSSQLVAFLPNVAANIQCAPHAAAVPVSTEQRRGDPPFDGLCRMWITWSEAVIDTDKDLGGGSSRQEQRFAWVFQP